ncbi:Spore maturation protein SpmB [Anaerosphaera aminiphila DSM 21120]|uniref:Spore maturation protein SpmB n=1 Tax=Anaerosphaera aminiphila DSM 21120 TaxID=1120995 RepID=A0A1M5TIC1_9FIRM|nr:nucleoside recognition domain-containing protein [Anaerosphaera aminiphila]SHH50502.1 Spore maturation protein SpmB [Anaerosphaera aminiphila DSM 21120]
MSEAKKIEKKEPAKESAIEVFMNGAKKGVGIGLNQIIPAMILGYTIVALLKLTGLIDILGSLFGPFMKFFGLPGESVVVLVSAFFAKAAGAATAANLYMAGVITAGQATILLVPCMLMGTLVGHYARIVLVADTNPKYRMILLFIPVFMSLVGMFVMKLIISAMGLM